jgi:class 3 adenylate cyclase/YHS domain-containing protein
VTASGEHTFVFADLAGFSALTEAHGDEHAADMAIEFCRELNRLLPEDAEDVKMLGDACLLRVGDAAEAVHLGVQVVGALASRHGFLNVRVGMHSGPAIRRGDDWFGATLNIAARVAELAVAGDVLLTEATHTAARTPVGVLFEDLGAHDLRHIGDPARLYRARAVAAPEQHGNWVLDPVCHMRLDADQSMTALTEADIEYFFCSSACAEHFSRSPQRYLGGVRRTQL